MTDRLAEKSDANFVCLVKGGERFVWLYDDNHQSEAIRSLGRFASNPDLSFTWYDAAIVSKRMREMEK